MKRFHTRTDSRRAFTLVEVLLVLALMVVIASFAWATLQRPLARQRLKSAAEDVRSEWCAGRVDAMKSGHTYAFRYLVHGSRFHLGPQDDPSAVETAPPAAAQNASSEDDGDDEPLPPPVDGSLPQGIHFVPCRGEDELPAMGEESDADAGEGWSDPIYFYADGSTSDAAIFVASGKNSPMRLQLRGITGSVTVADGTSTNQ